MENYSIHPRVRLGGDLKDTSRPYKGKGKLATLKRLPSTVPPDAFKTPGSMNQHK